MFSKNRETGEALAAERFRTVIDATTTIDGRLNVKESVRIDGRVIGDVNLESGSKATVAIASTGAVRGDIAAHRVLVAGQVQGNIQAVERVELLSTAQVSGDITYGSISIAHGAKVVGLLVEVTQSTDASGKTDAVIRAARIGESGANN
jgi:cytoskeletal protein CcmA (bactofilin family)